MRAARHADGMDYAAVDAAGNERKEEMISVRRISHFLNTPYPDFRRWHGEEQNRLYTGKEGDPQCVY